MPRYTDADKFTERIQASPAFPNMGMDGYFLRNVVCDLLDNMPTSDVVPKSEVDKARQDGFEKGKRYLAREIYVKLYNEIIEARDSNYRAIKEREEKHNVNRYEDTFCYYCDGKIHALDGIFHFFDETIKEYFGEDIKVPTTKKLKDGEYNG